MVYNKNMTKIFILIIRKPFSNNSKRSQPYNKVIIEQIGNSHWNQNVQKIYAKVFNLICGEI